MQLQVVKNTLKSMTQKERHPLVETGKIIVKTAEAIGFLGLLSRFINLKSVRVLFQKGNTSSD